LLDSEPQNGDNRIMNTTKTQLDSEIDQIEMLGRKLAIDFSSNEARGIGYTGLRNNISNAAAEFIRSGFLVHVYHDNDGRSCMSVEVKK